MFDFQTLSCLHAIPVVRSSTAKLQDVYTKAKDTSVLIRFPCHLAETMADKSLKIASTIVSPFSKLLSEPVRRIDDYAAQTIRQIETKYPIINTSTEDVIDTLNTKAKPVRHVVNSVKYTTTSTIQQGKDTVSNVATATVNKASNVADSAFVFCRAHVPAFEHRYMNRKVQLNKWILSNIDSVLNSFRPSIQSSLIWFRMLTVHVLLRTKQINDRLLNKIQRDNISIASVQRLSIALSTFIECSIRRIRPDDKKFRSSQQYTNRRNSQWNEYGTNDKQQSYIVNEEVLTNHLASASNDLSQSTCEIDANELLLKSTSNVFTDDLSNNSSPSADD